MNSNAFSFAFVPQIDNAEMLVMNNDINLGPESESSGVSASVNINAINSKTCPFGKNGCQWVLRTTSEAQEHIKECKYRPYACIGNMFKVWK